MITECPHCYTRVIPNEDGVCPACGGDVNDTGSADATKTSVTISSNEVLPERCIFCCSHTDRFKMYKASARPDKGDGAGDEGIGVVALLGGLLGMAGGLLGMLLGASALSSVFGPKRRVMINIPVCHVCAPDNPVKPRTVDFDRMEAIFVVHRDFAEALARRRGDQ